MRISATKYMDEFEFKCIEKQNDSSAMDVPPCGRVEYSQAASGSVAGVAQSPSGSPSRGEATVLCRYTCLCAM